MRKIIQLLFISISAYCQTPSVISSTNLGGNGNDNSKKIIKTSDGNFVIVGTTTSNTGNFATNHGGSDILVRKVTPTGTILWTKLLGGSSTDEGVGIVEDSDGGFVILGRTYSNNGDVIGKTNPFPATWIFKINSSGTSITWQHLKDAVDYGYYATTYDGKAIIRSANGDFIIALDSYVQNPSRGIPFILRLNSSGNTVWSQLYDFDPYDVGYTSMVDLVEKSTGEIVALGKISGAPSISNYHNPNYPNGLSNNKDVFLMKTSSIGNLSWSKCYGGNLTENAYDLEIDGSNNLFFASSTTSTNGDLSSNAGGSDAWIVKTDDTGVILWQNIYGTPNGDFYSNISILSSGEVIAVGKTNANVLLSKYSSNGTNIWHSSSYNLNNSSDYYYPNLITQGNDIYVVADYYYPNDEIYLLKYGICTTPTASVTPTTQTITLGQGTNLTATFTGTPPFTLTNPTGGTYTNITANTYNFGWIPSTVGQFNYIGTVTNICGNASTNQYTVIVKPTPPTIILGTTQPNCSGSQNYIYSSGCNSGTITWSTNQTGSSIYVYPSVNTSYTATCTQNGQTSVVSNAVSVEIATGTISQINSTAACDLLILKANFNITSLNNSSVRWQRASGDFPYKEGNTVIAYGGGSYTFSLKLSSGCTLMPTSYFNTNSSVSSPEVSSFYDGGTPNTSIKMWDKNLGGTGSDYSNDIIKTNDGGYLIGGFSFSGIGADKSQNSQAGSADYWVIKLDANRNKIWDKTFGSTAYDQLKKIIELPDGYLLGGTSSGAISGDKSQISRGGDDYWVVKIDFNGNKVWDKTFGGNNSDQFTDMIYLNNIIYLFGNSSSNISGDVTQSTGYIGYWLVKVDTDGNKLADYNYSGTNSSYAGSLAATIDGDIILSGYSYSGIGNAKTEASIGSGDFWILKVNQNGIKTWDKTYGGTLIDLPNSLIIDNTNILIGGYSYSSSGTKKSAANYGIGDFWVVKLDNLGNKIWDYSFGGSDDDILNNLIKTPDNNFLAVGYSKSGISGNKTTNFEKGGSLDYWALKFDEAGAKLWENVYGTIQQEIPRKTLLETDGSYTILGDLTIYYPSGDNSNNSKGYLDYWLLNIKETEKLPNNTSNAITTNNVRLRAKYCNGIVTWSNGITGSEIFVSQSGTYTATCANVSCTSTTSESIFLDITQPCTTLLQLLNPANNISSNPDINGTIKQAAAANGLIQATNIISGTGTRATYQAKVIELNEGFKADNGTVFIAEVGGCN